MAGLREVLLRSLPFFLLKNFPSERTRTDAQMSYNVSMNKLEISADDSRAVLYLSASERAPLVVITDDENRAGMLPEAVALYTKAPFNLLVMCSAVWEQDLTPWECPAPSRSIPACGNGADKYLELITQRIVPEVLKSTAISPERFCIAGYSLAGLFALYALYKTPLFDSAASISGSLWYPHFKEYIKSHTPLRAPHKLYLSVGDAEDKTKNAYLSKVLVNTQEIYGHYQRLGYDVSFELNPGNHFQKALERTARGIASLL